MTTQETSGPELTRTAARVSHGTGSEKSYMPDKAFEELRNDLAAAGSKRDQGDIAGAYGYLSRGVRMFLEQWMAEQEQRDDWATAQEAHQYALDVRLEQGAYR